MCCCSGIRIIQSGAITPFTFSVTAGNSPYAGGAGVITGPISINNNDVIHFYSLNTINFDVTPGSANVHAEVRLDPNPLNTLSSSAAGLLNIGGSFVANDFDNLSFTTDIDWDFNNNDWNISNLDAWTVDSNSISFNAPVICLTGITQNDALTRFLVQDAGGCLSWRDASSITATINNPVFVSNQTWDFSNNDWSITNVDALTIDANSISINAPVICLTGITQNNALTQFLVMDAGGCLAWRDESTITGGDGDADWLTIQTTNPELFSSNNAWRQGGIGVVGFPHSTNTPFDTNDLIYDIEVGAQNRGSIGVNGSPNASAPISFQLLTTRNGGIEESAISIGSHVSPGITTAGILVSPVGPIQDNLLISHKKDGNGGGDTPILMFYGSGTANIEAGIVVTDAASASVVSIPLEQFTVNATTKTPRVLVQNDNPIAKNASLYFNTFNGVNRGMISMGEYMNAGGSIIDSTTDSLWISQAGAGNPIMSANPVTGGWYIGNGFPQQAGLTDLFVQGSNQLITFGDYPQTRDDSGAFPPINFLYTNAAGDVLSAPTTILGGGGGAINVQDEGITVGTPAGITNMNFVGAGVTVVGAGANATITIPGGGAGVNIYNADGVLDDPVRTFGGANGNLLFDNFFRIQIGGAPGNVDEFYATADTVNLGNGAASVVNLDTDNVNILITPPSATTGDQLMVRDTVTGQLRVAPNLTIGAAKALVVNGDLDVTGLIDPTGVQFTQQAANPGTVDTIWINSANGHAFRGPVDLELGAINVQDEGSTVGTANGITNINFVGAGVSVIGAGSNATVTISGGGGGGITSFNVSDGTTTENITDGETIVFADSALIGAVVTATNTVTHSILPGANGQIMYTIAGTPTWAFIQDIFDIINFTTNVVWDFNNNDWTINNVDDWTVDSNTITFNAPSICFTGLANDLISTRILVQTAGGCLGWRDLATNPLTNVDITNQSFTSNVNWNFNNNDWAITNVDAWTVDSNSISFNAPIICLTGITQNDALTRILAQDAGGCLSWRDAATLGGGGGLTAANNGLSVNGSTVQWGDNLPGGAPLLFNTNIDMAGFTATFGAVSAAMVGAPSGQATNLIIGNTYGQILSSNGYDFENVFPNTDFIGAVDVGFAVWNNAGQMKRVNHDQMPYHVRTINSDTTLTSRDSTVEVDTTSGPVTITLNSGTNFYNQAVANDGQGKKFKIKKSAGTNPVTIVVNAGGTIDGFTSIIITNLNDAVELQADSPTSYIAIGDYTASGTNYVGGGPFNGKGSVRFITANYTATLTDETIISTTAGTDITVTLPDRTNAYVPTSATTGEGKKLTIIHQGQNTRRTRIQPFGGGSSFINENGHLIAYGSRFDVQCISNTSPQEASWTFERHDYSTLSSTSQGFTNVSNPSAGVPLNVTWNRQRRTMSFDYAPGTEPSVINIDLGSGGNPLSPGGIDYNGQEFEIYVARIGACPINLDFGTATRNGATVPAGIVVLPGGDYTHTKLHGVWGGATSSTWLVS